MEYKDKFQDKDKNITLYNMDCMELLKNTEDNFYDLAIVDPPYGIDLANMNLGVGKSKKASKAKPKQNLFKIDRETKKTKEAAKDKRKEKIVKKFIGEK